MTRAELLTHYIAFALIDARKIVRGLKRGLSEQERFAVAKRTVEHLMKYGDPWKLAEELPDTTGRGLTTHAPLGPYDEP